MGIARSTFYYNGKHSFSDEIEANLRDRIELICLEFPRYGYRRVTRQLEREGWNVNHKKVLRLFGKAICFVGSSKVG